MLGQPWSQISVKSLNNNRPFYDQERVGLLAKAGNSVEMAARTDATFYPEYRFWERHNDPTVGLTAVAQINVGHPHYQT